MDVFRNYSGKSFIKSFKGVFKISYREMSAELSLDMSLRISSDMLLRIRFRSFPRIPSETSLGITLEILLGCPLINPSEGIRSFSRVSSIIFLTDTEVSYFFIKRCSALSEVIFKHCFRKYYSQQRFFFRMSFSGFFRNSYRYFFHERFHRFPRIFFSGIALVILLFKVLILKSLLIGIPPEIPAELHTKNFSGILVCNFSSMSCK